MDFDPNADARPRRTLLYVIWALILLAVSSFALTLMQVFPVLPRRPHPQHARHALRESNTTLPSRGGGTVLAHYTCVTRSLVHSLVLLLAIAMQVAVPLSAGAQKVPRTPLPSEHGMLQPRLPLALRHSGLVLDMEEANSLQMGEVSARNVPRECTPRYMAGPALGVPLGLGAFMGGVVMVTVGNFHLWEPEPKSRGDRGLIAGGSILMAAGLASFIYSSVKISNNRHTRRRVCGSRRSE